MEHVRALVTQKRLLWSLLPVSVLLGVALAWTRLANYRRWIQPSLDGKTRPLSVMERWYSAHEHCGVLPHFFMCLQMTGPVWSEKEAKNVISKVISKHPNAMCTIFDDDNHTFEPYWKRLWDPNLKEDQQGIIDIQLRSLLPSIQAHTMYGHFVSFKRSQASFPLFITLTHIRSMFLMSLESRQIYKDVCDT